MVSGGSFQYHDEWKFLHRTSHLDFSNVQPVGRHPLKIPLAAILSIHEKDEPLESLQ